MSTLNQQAAQTILQKQNELAEFIVTRQYGQKPEVWNPFGEPGRAKSVRDAGYHLTYLSAALNASDPTLFSEYLIWVKVLFAGLKFGEHILPTTIKFTHQALDETLPDELKPIAFEYLDSAMAAFDDSPSTLVSFIQNDDPFSRLTHTYMDSLLSGDRQSASQMILDAVAQGTRIQDIYLHVFQSSQREIGRLWQTNQISVAQEHYFTAATQMIMSQLYPFIFSTERKGKRMVATCVDGELHEVGMRMVADFFEMDGWDTYFLGANTPMEGILNSLVERKADVLAISATMTFHIDKVVNLIAGVRRAGLDGSLKILVGGYPFNISQDLWRSVGADACGHDALQAVGAANSLSS